MHDKSVTNSVRPVASVLQSLRLASRCASRAAVAMFMSTSKTGEMPMLQRFRERLVTYKGPLLRSALVYLIGMGLVALIVLLIDAFARFAGGHFVVGLMVVIGDMRAIGVLLVSIFAVLLFAYLEARVTVAAVETVHERGADYPHHQTAMRAALSFLAINAVAGAALAAVNFVAAAATGWLEVALRYLAILALQGAFGVAAIAVVCEEEGVVAAIARSFRSWAHPRELLLLILPLALVQALPCPGVLGAASTLPLGASLAMEAVLQVGGALVLRSLLWVPTLTWMALVYDERLRGALRQV